MQPKRLVLCKRSNVDWRDAQDQIAFDGPGNIASMSLFLVNGGYMDWPIIEYV
ncbi:hypothetical protein POX_a00518 [Penicillium oxalicum]|uniref:hypothetical protein n=1 Tax=Penicillium oxalicum TaxID=69781 RepID=UPI0020B7D4BE|nr:hypothetical protein POX_a00518 [Penicillium oxalicum]KAI2793930.1 hypothetical protein POX_a00518 [Penicillium oxalicum]